MAWQEWELRQRDVITGARPGMTEDEHEAVAQRFAALGIMSSKERRTR